MAKMTGGTRPSTMGLEIHQNSHQPSHTVLPVTARERWGWYLYDCAYAPLTYVAQPVLLPLLLLSLADHEAWNRLGQPAPPACHGGPSDSCVRCIAEEGDKLMTPQGPRELPGRSVCWGALCFTPLHWVVALLAASLLVQLAVLVTLGPLAGDYLRRKKMLTLTTLAGALACFGAMAVDSGHLWWLVGILLIVVNACFGLAAVCYYCYLPVLVDATQQVLDAAAAGLPPRALYLLRSKIENKMSQTGLALGHLAAAACSGALVAALHAGAGDRLILRLGLGTAGAGCLGLSLISLRWLSARAGSAAGPPPGKRASLAGWGEMWELLARSGRHRHAFRLLLCFSLYAGALTTTLALGFLYGARSFCLSRRAAAALLTTVSLAAAAGAPVSLRVQRVLFLWGSKGMLALLLALSALAPAWGLLAPYLPCHALGVRHRWELFALAAWLGFCLGALASYSRTLFLNLVPRTHDAGMLTLYVLCERASSFIGPLLVFVVYHHYGLRMSLLVLLGMLVGPLVLLCLVREKEGMVDAGRYSGVDSCCLPECTLQASGPAAQADACCAGAYWPSGAKIAPAPLLILGS
eukprot:jgi/Mesen1/8993/ME000056S08399